MLKSVKKLIALGCTLVFLILSVIGKISPEQFMNIFTMIICTYFGQSIASKK